MNWSEILRRYDVQHSDIRVGATHLFRLAHIRDINALVDAMGPDDFGEDERLPYWASLWPVARQLAAFVVESPALIQGPVLEMGCGLGLVSLAVAAIQQEILATDYEPEALSFTLENARLNDLRVKVQQWDWRLLDQMNGQFQTVMAADVLYEARQLEPMVKALSQLVRPGGIALIGDPNRPYLGQFRDRLGDHGFRIELVEGVDHTLIKATKSELNEFEPSNLG